METLPMTATPPFVVVVQVVVVTVVLPTRNEAVRTETKLANDGNVVQQLERSVSFYQNDPVPPPPPPPQNKNSSIVSDTPLFAIRVRLG